MHYALGSWALLSLVLYCHGSTNSTNIKILTFNIWKDGGGQPMDHTSAVITASGANIVGLQESQVGTAQTLSNLLGWKFYIQHGDDLAILSSWEIVDSLPNNLGAIIRKDNQTLLHLINLHLAHCPYEPYQLLDIPYCGAPTLEKTEQATIASALASRGTAAVETIKEVVQEIVLDHNHTPPLIFITGDFNEPSHRDWTQQAAQQGRHPLKVAWPTTKTLEEELSFVDAYRTIHPDEITHPGYTWTPTTSIDDPNDHHDRIDFVFYYYNPRIDVNDTTRMIQTTHVEILGPDNSDVVVTPYPSDHRAVVATFEIDDFDNGGMNERKEVWFEVEDSMGIEQSATRPQSSSSITVYGLAMLLWILAR